MLDWFKVAVAQDNGAYILGVNPDPVLFPVDNALMESQLNNNSNLPCCWTHPPHSQAIITGSEVCIDCSRTKSYEEGSRRSSGRQEEDPPPRKQFGVEQVNSISVNVLLAFPQKWSCPHLYCTSSWITGSPRPHYPSNCVCSPMSRGRGNINYCPHCDTHLCPRKLGLWPFPA